MKEEDWQEGNIFAYSMFETGALEGVNFNYFDIWKPKIWHTFCFLFKNDEVTLYLDTKRITKQPFKLKVMYW